MTSVSTRPLNEAIAQVSALLDADPGDRRLRLHEAGPEVRAMDLEQVRA